MSGPYVDEVDLHSGDHGGELRQRVQPCLALAPVVLGRPVAGELPQRCQLHALRPIRDESLLGKRVTERRRRRSAKSSSWTLTRKGRIASALLVPIGEPPFDRSLALTSRAATKYIGSKLTAPVAADPQGGCAGWVKRILRSWSAPCFASMPLANGNACWRARRQPPRAIGSPETGRTCPFHEQHLAVGKSSGAIPQSRRRL